MSIPWLAAGSLLAPIQRPARYLRPSAAILVHRAMRSTGRWANLRWHMQTRLSVIMLHSRLRCGKGTLPFTKSPRASLKATACFPRNISVGQECELLKKQPSHGSLAVFLCSDAASQMRSAAVTVDGAWTDPVGTGLVLIFINVQPPLPQYASEVRPKSPKKAAFQP